MTHREFIQKQIQPFLPKKISRVAFDAIHYEDGSKLYLEDIASRYIKGWIYMCDEWDAANLLDVEFVHIYL